MYAALLCLCLAAEPTPAHPVLARFPPPAVAAACAEAALEHEKWCGRHLDLATGPAECARWQAALKDAAWRRRVWVELCGCWELRRRLVMPPEQGGAMGWLQEELGPAAWWGGAMPPPVPYWRVER